jgi:hypothetical protein
MNDKDFDRLLAEAAQIRIPEGLGDRLEKQIDAWAAKEKKRKWRLYTPIAVVAACLCLGWFLQTGSFQSSPCDTFSNPEEAALAAGKALAFMSEQFNKGMEHVAGAEKEIQKVNKVLYKHFK